MGRNASSYEWENGEVGRRGNEGEKSKEPVGKGAEGKGGSLGEWEVVTAVELEESGKGEIEREGERDVGRESREGESQVPDVCREVEVDDVSVSESERERFLGFSTGSSKISKDGGREGGTAAIGR